MKEYPIPFSGAMVRAILDGAKTQTRRVIKPQPQVAEGEYCPVLRWKRVDMPLVFAPATIAQSCPHGQPGARLWVRETWAVRQLQAGCWLEYAADAANFMTSHPDAPALAQIDKWRPSIHMPRWASRLTLEIESVRAERLQDMSEADAQAEGFGGYEYDGAWVSPAWEFRETWDAINAKRGFGWGVNPWVWAIAFRKVEV